MQSVLELISGWPPVMQFVLFGGLALIGAAGACGLFVAVCNFISALWDEYTSVEQTEEEQRHEMQLDMQKLMHTQQLELQQKQNSHQYELQRLQTQRVNSVLALLDYNPDYEDTPIEPEQAVELLKLVIDPKLVNSKEPIDEYLAKVAMDYKACK